MVLEERKCPNCGSGELLEKDGTIVCMNCRTFFDNPNDIKITKTVRDEAKIEKIKAEERREKEGDKFAIILIGMFLVVLIIARFFG